MKDNEILEEIIKLENELEYVKNRADSIKITNRLQELDEKLSRNNSKRIECMNIR